jgi:hypothetical protein
MLGAIGDESLSASDAETFDQDQNSSPISPI